MSTFVSIETVYCQDDLVTVGESYVDGTGNKVNYSSQGDVGRTRTENTR